MEKQIPLIRDCMIVNVEGTISSSKWREALKEKENPRAYYNGIEFDSPIPWTRAVINFAKVDCIFYVSDAPWYLLSEISNWLNKHKFREGFILPTGTIINKEKLIQSQILSEYTVRLVLETKKNDIEMYKNNGLLVHECTDPNLFPIDNSLNSKYKNQLK